MNVSIITVVYNGAETIRDCIDSVLNQTHPHLEYIVIDGGSTDGTADIVRSYGAKIARFVSEPDQGIYDAMNKGIRLATGEIIGLLNADDLYRHKNVVSHIVATLNQTGTDAVYSDMIYVDRQDTSRILRYWPAGSYQKGSFLWGWMPGHLSLFIRRRVYEQYGLFTMALRSAADYELMLRFIHRHQISLSYLNELTIVMRVGGVSNQSWSHRLRANREDQEAWRLNGIKPYFFTLWLKPLRKLSQFIRKPPAD